MYYWADTKVRNLQSPKIKWNKKSEKKMSAKEVCFHPEGFYHILETLSSSLKTTWVLGMGDKTQSYVPRQEIRCKPYINKVRFKRTTHSKNE